MFRHPIKPLSSTPRTEDVAKLTRGRAVLLNYSGQGYLAITTPSTRPTYHIEEIIDAEHESALYPFIHQKARSLGAQESFEHHVDDKRNLIVTFSPPGKPSETTIWPPVNILVHEADGGSYENKSPYRKAYAAISYHPSRYRKLVDKHSGMIIPPLPDSIYLLSDTPHVRTNFDTYYRMHCAHPATTTHLQRIFEELIGGASKSKGVHATVSPLHLLPYVSRLKGQSPTIDATETATIRSHASLLSYRPSGPTPAYTPTWFAKSLRPVSTSPASRSPWK